MGVVYKARQRSLNRIVALKMIKTGELANDGEIERFRMEAEAAAGLDHPHIVPVYEVGQQQGRHYFSMGYVEGESLAQRLKDGPLSPREAAELVKTIAEAVDYAHSQGIIHRDLKPSNVLLEVKSQESRVESRTGSKIVQSPESRVPSQTGSTGTSSASGSRLSTLDSRPRITDFGLAKQIASDSGLTATGQVMGTPSYMPPEQAAGRAERVDVRSDVYALGAILYCALVGRPPFQAANAVETIKQVMHRDPVAPRALNPAVDRDLETICLKCLEKDAARRYATAAAMAADLGSWLENRPIAARAVGRVGRAWRWCRRNRAVASMTAAIALSLVLGTLVSTSFALVAQWRASSEAEARLLADDERKKAETAAHAEAAARTTAEARESETRSVLDFVEGKVFAAARPEGLDGGLGHDVRLRDAVHAALPFVEESFADQPLIEARLRSTMGVSSLYLGEAETARQQLQRARQAYAEAQGPDHPDTLWSMQHLANAYVDQDRHEEALRLREETFALRQARFGPEDANTLQSMCDVAESMVELDRGVEAVPIIDECVERAAGRVALADIVRDVMLLRLGYFEKVQDAAGCRATAEKWENLGHTDSESLYRAAYMRAVTAAVVRVTDRSPEGPQRADAEADRAMHWLQQAVAGGFNNTARIVRISSFDSLRDREDYRKLLAELRGSRPPSH
jgi:tetratricopeptide (TPR) repeat protein